MSARLNLDLWLDELLTRVDEYVSAYNIEPPMLLVSPTFSERVKQAWVDDGNSPPMEGRHPLEEVLGVPVMELPIDRDYRPLYPEEAKKIAFMAERRNL